MNLLMQSIVVLLNVAFLEISCVLCFHLYFYFLEFNSLDLLGRYCARLIHGWGGRLGTLKNTPDGKQLMAKMKKISIDDVRMLINHLIGKGYDKKIPERRNEQEILVSNEVSSELVLITENTRLRLEEACVFLDSKCESLRSVLETFKLRLRPYLSTTVAKIQGAPESAGVRPVLAFDELFQVLDSDDIIGDDPFEDGCGCIDSDEEAKLYEELDTLLDAQERAFAFKGNNSKFMANAFQKVFLRIQELEHCFELVSVFLLKTDLKIETT